MRIAAILFSMLVATVATAEEPVDYYAGTDGLVGVRLHRVLHQIIDDHERHPYTSSFETDTWDIIHQADQADDSDQIRDLYRNRLFDRNDHWSDSNRNGWNREHSWPKSYGFADGDDPCNSAYTDVHALFASDPYYNQARGNIPYDWVTDGTPLPVDELGFANYVTGRYESGAFEVWPMRRGDVARAMFYMAVRYDGGTNERNGCNEPDLRLTSDRDDFVWSGKSNLDVAYMGILSTLLEWHLEDPVDDHERRRHEIVHSYQGNRNPFVDRPEWVCALWSCELSGTLTASISTFGRMGQVVLDWEELDGPTVEIFRYDALLTSTGNDGEFVDTVTPAGTYRYRVCESGTCVCADTAVSFHQRRRATAR